MKIIAVDDDPITLELLRDSLTTDGHAVDTVESAEDALTLLGAGDARVVITDWEMPGLTGPQLCQSIREMDLGRYIFIIMLTSHNDQTRLIEGLRSGADDFLSKPFDPTELSIRISIAERVTTLETRDLLIFTLAQLAESRDPETGQHLERVQLYCRLLAEELKSRRYGEDAITPEFIKLLSLTSPLHDIGKVGIPDGVLLKPGRLTETEFAVMKTHATIGADTLDRAIRKSSGAGFLLMAHDITIAHHEKFDGAGYPYGIAGTQIPLAARIMAVADVYDALRSKRIYKPAISHEQACGIIQEGRGNHFDPDMVDGFLAVESQFSDISHRLAGESLD